VDTAASLEIGRSLGGPARSGELRGTIPQGCGPDSTRHLIQVLTEQTDLGNQNPPQGQKGHEQQVGEILSSGRSLFDAFMSKDGTAVCVGSRLAPGLAELLPTKQHVRAAYTATP
jgi:hypothetical protein